MALHELPQQAHTDIFDPIDTLMRTDAESATYHTARKNALEVMLQTDVLTSHITVLADAFEYVKTELEQFVSTPSLPRFVTLSYLESIAQAMSTDGEMTTNITIHSGDVAKVTTTKQSGGESLLTQAVTPVSLITPFRRVYTQSEDAVLEMLQQVEDVIRQLPSVQTVLHGGGATVTSSTFTTAQLKSWGVDESDLDGLQGALEKLVVDSDGDVFSGTGTVSVQKEIDALTPPAPPTATHTSSAAPLPPVAAPAPTVPSIVPATSTIPMYSVPTYSGVGGSELFTPGQAQQVAPGAVAKPAHGTFTSGFGMRWGSQHKGIDIAGPIGTPIYAVMDGTVINSGPASGFGNWVRIQHAGGTISVYGHMQANMIFVRVGDQVTAGQHIAGIGNEGQSTGPHLHFEIYPNGGSAVDPRQWLAAHGVSV